MLTCQDYVQETDNHGDDNSYNLNMVNLFWDSQWELFGGVVIKILHFLNRTNLRWSAWSEHFKVSNKLTSRDMNISRDV